MISSKYWGTQILVPRNYIFHGVSKTCCDCRGSTFGPWHRVLWLGWQEATWSLLNREKPKRVWGSLQKHIVELNVSCSSLRFWVWLCKDEIGHSWWHPQYHLYIVYLCLSQEIWRKLSMLVWPFDGLNHLLLVYRWIYVFSSGPFLQHRLKQKSNRQGVCRVEWETISVFGDSTYSTSLVYVVRRTWIIFQILSIYVRTFVDYGTSSLTWCDMWYRTVDFVQSWLCWNSMRIKTSDVPCIIPYIFHN